MTAATIAGRRSRCSTRRAFLPSACTGCRRTPRILDLAAKAYDTAIAGLVGQGAPALDLIVLGVGDDGHTASLFPGDPTVDVTDRLVAAVPARPGREARLTLTRPVIQQAGRVLVLVVGAAKRPALARAWAREGDVHETPSRIIRDCKGVVTWIVDEAAAGPG